MKFIAAKKAVIVSVVSAVALSGALLANPAFAAEGKKKIDAVYRNIKLMYNNKQVSVDASLEPFILNGTTYIPLRYAGELFNKEIAWDSKTNTINVKDKENASNGGGNAGGGNTSDESQRIITDLYAQISSLQSKLNTANAEVTDREKQIAALEDQAVTLKNQIKALEDEVKKLNAQLSKKEEVDLGDLEDELNDDYADYENTNGDIDLKGDSEKLTVTIKVDATAWAALSESEQEDYLQDIVDDIIDETGEIDISGTVKNRSNSTTLIAFAVDGDDVEMDDISERLEELEEELNDDYGDYEGIDLTIELSGDKEEIAIKVTVTEADWGTLNSSERNELYEELLESVKDEFEDAEVEGDVYAATGNKRLASFD